MAALSLAAIILAGLYLRERRTSARLCFNEQFARSCMRDAINSRDELVKEFFDEKARNTELRLELMAYRAEAGQRELERIYS